MSLTWADFDDVFKKNPEDRHVGEYWHPLTNNIGALKTDLTHAQKRKNGDQIYEYEEFGIRKQMEEAGMKFTRNKEEFAKNTENNVYYDGSGYFYATKFTLEKFGAVSPKEVSQQKSQGRGSARNLPGLVLPFRDNYC